MLNIGKTLGSVVFSLRLTQQGTEVLGAARRGGTGRAGSGSPVAQEEFNFIQCV